MRSHVFIQCYSTSSVHCRRSSWWSRQSAKWNFNLLSGKRSKLLFCIIGKQHDLIRPSLWSLFPLDDPERCSVLFSLIHWWQNWIALIIMSIVCTLDLGVSVIVVSCAMVCACLDLHLFCSQTAVYKAKHKAKAVTCEEWFADHSIYKLTAYNRFGKNALNKKYNKWFLEKQK